MAEYPPIPGSAEDAWREFSDDLAIISDSLARRLGSLIVGLVNGFPNPFSMGDAVVGFLTALPAIFVEAPIRRHWRTARENIDEVAHSRLMRPEDACRFFEDVLVDTGSMFVGISPDTLVEWILRRAAIWLWHTFKSAKLLVGLLRISNEADALRLVRSLFKSRLVVLRLKVVLGLFGIVFYLVARISGLVVAFRYAQIKDYCLAQDSRRVRVKTTGQKRINKRAGSDLARLVLPP